MTGGLFIVGTDTNVGKTIVAAGLINILRENGYHAGYFKPVSSGGVRHHGKIISYDARFVKAVTGLTESDDLINPFRFMTAVSPHLAAVIEQKPIDLAVINTNYAILKNKYDYLITEGCGGWAVPLTPDLYMQSELIKELGLNCVIVSRTALGTINHTLLTVQAAENLKIGVGGIIFSGYTGSEMEQNNIKTIRDLSKVPVLGILPYLHGMDTENLKTDGLGKTCEETLELDGVLKAMSDKQARGGRQKARVASYVSVKRN
jgi:dethiobiotin synthetase